MELAVIINSTTKQQRHKQRDPKNRFSKDTLHPNLKFNIDETDGDDQDQGGTVQCTVKDRSKYMWWKPNIGGTVRWTDEDRTRAHVGETNGGIVQWTGKTTLVNLRKRGTDQRTQQLKPKPCARDTNLRNERYGPKETAVKTQTLCGDTNLRNERYSPKKT